MKIKEFNNVFYRRLLFVITMILVLSFTSLFIYNKQDAIIATIKPKNFYYYYNAYVSAFFSGELYGADTVVSASNDAHAIPVIMYHSVLDKPDGSNVTLKDFTEQMLAMHKAGYRTVSVEDVYDFINGKKKLPDKSFLLTFDDGRKNSYYPADPLLKALDYKAVMFVIMNRVHEDDPYHLSIAELEDMRDSGRWELQSHGKADHDLYVIDGNGNKGYFMSNKLWLNDQARLESNAEFSTRIHEDMLSAKQDLLNLFGVQSLSYAFPFGDYGQNSINFRESAQSVIKSEVSSVYPLAFYQMPLGSGPLFNYPRKGTFLMKRIDVTVSNWTADDLMRVLAIGSSKALPYEPTDFSIPGWTHNWGTMNLSDDIITLASTETETGSFAFFDGSIAWTNYQYSAHVDVVRGGSVGLVARYQDNNNYVDCNFGPDLIHIDQNEQGIRRVIQGEHYEGLPHNGATIGIRVQGRTVQCLLNGKVITSTPFLSPSLSVGGIALKTWDSKINNSKVNFSKIIVKEL